MDARRRAESALRALLANMGLDGEAEVAFTGEDHLHASAFQAGGAVGVALAAVGVARGARKLRVDLDLAALTSEGYRHVALDGAPVAAPRDALTGFYSTRDGRPLFLHVNFPHHRERALRVLDAEPTRAGIEAQVRARDLHELDAALADAGAVAAPALDAARWDESGQGRLVAGLPLIEITRIDDSPPEPAPGVPCVIDVTRVLAGPTCGRMLAESGAQVTRIDHPDLPDLPAYRLDANRDKNELTLDLRDPADLARLRDMARRADVFLQAYRPGAASRLGLDAETLASVRPGLVYASLSAFGHAGPWSQRRGFDSVVQAATGLAMAQGRGAPALLPTSPLDYAAGFLLAAGVETALRRRARDGGSWLVRTSLAQVAHWLRGFPHETVPEGDPERRAAMVRRRSIETRRPAGLIRHLRSAMTIADEHGDAR